MTSAYFFQGECSDSTIFAAMLIRDALDAGVIVIKGEAAAKRERRDLARRADAEAGGHLLAVRTRSSIHRNN